MSEETPPAGTGTKNAMAKLRENHGLKIDWGKYIAVKIALKKRTVHSREVRDSMVAEKLIDGNSKEFWLGAVFKELAKEKILLKSGKQYSYSDESRGIHERTVALWELNEEADLTAYRQPPKDIP